jgi:putative endonuclease
MSLYLQNLGKIGENLALDYLKNHGFVIIEKNFRSKFGEIDIIAEKNRCLYFVEVKTRSNLDHGYPHEAVNKRKIYHIKKAAQYYLLKKSFPDYKLKISVFSVLTDKEKTEIKFWENIDN